jgi:predicted transposase YdaD
LSELDLSEPLLQPALIDRSVKALIRAVPGAFFRLAGVQAREYRFEDVTLNLPEFRADHVLIVGLEGDPVSRAIHLEYQFQPDRSVLPNWLLKRAALAVRLGVPVVLVVIYLTKGKYQRFPRSVTDEVGTLRNEFRFHTIRLWEHVERIRGGDLPELAPLLVLCEDEPTERTLQEERRLILGLEVTPVVRAELLAVALTAGLRYFGRDLLETVFREELQMLKQASIIQDWLDEALKEGEARGEAKRAQEILIELLRRRFGEIPPDLLARIEREGPEWCQESVLRAAETGSLEGFRALIA